GFTLVLRMGIVPSRGKLSTKRVARGAMPFAAYEVGNALYMNIVIILLFLMQAPEETGWFTAALRVLTFLLLIPSAFDAAIYPVFSRLYKKSMTDLRFAFGKSMKFSFIASLPVALVLMVMADDFASLFGADFANSARILEIIAFVLPLFTLNIIMKTALWSADQQTRMAVNIWISGLILAVAGFILIQERSYIGAGLAFFIGESCLLALNWQAVSRKRMPLGRQLWKPALAAAGMIGVANLLDTLYDISDIHLLTFALVVYALLLISLSTFTKMDRELLRSALRLPRRPPEDG
ncbi:MAG: polysaccharide biosynthesis C-terminal domain-containing protein, partial [Thermoplasmata archaeon]|nr:polysaccharide biosynthesis C-terminal domain-containing protein [Thermoplasmata archaeon]